MRDTHGADKMCVGDPFTLLELHVICRDDMGKKQFDFVDRKESLRTVEERWDVTLKMKQLRRSG